MMNTAMLGLLAETPVHPGTGRGTGVVDLPVAREAATYYPVLVGSSLKGALKDKMASSAEEKRDALFGMQDKAGSLLVADARLLLLPVRSLSRSYRWLTCPHIIERYCRDLKRAGLKNLPKIPDIARGSVLATGDGDLFLEEFQFSVNSSEPLEHLAKTIEPLILHPEAKKRLSHQLAILHDDDFSWFARYGLPVQARNLLEQETKKSKNLWYEETLPADTLMYALIAGRSETAINSLDELFPGQDQYLQAGGNETVGQGWFAVTIRRPDMEKG